jgi:MFS family permease
MTEHLSFCEYARDADGFPRKRAMTRWLGDIRGRGLGVVLGCLVCQMGLGFGYVFGPLAPDILAEFGWTRAMYSSARAPQLFVIALASPLVGAMTIRFGARRVLSGAALLLGIAFCLLSGLESLWQLTALVVMTGLAITGLGDIAVGQVVSQWVARGRGLALGIVYTGSNLGDFLLTRIAGGVADASSWRAAFLGMGVAGLLVLLPVAYWVVREPRIPASGAPGAGADPAAAPEQISEIGGDADMNLAMALRTRSFWILAFSLFTFFFYFISLLEHLVLFLTDEGLPRDAAVAYFSNAIALGLVSKVGLGLVADRIPHKAALLVDYGVLALSSGVLLWLPHPTLLPLFIAVFGFSYAARDVVYPLMVTHCYGLRFMAPIYGAMMLTLLPGGVLGPIFAAAIHDHFGSYAIAFRTFAVLNAVAVVALFFVRNERVQAGARSPAGP